MSREPSIRSICAGAVVVSLGLSAWCWWQEDIINKDGMRYVETARYVAVGDLSQAVRTYKWPFYSALMAGMARLTGVELEAAAHLLNAVCMVILVLAFLGIVRVLWRSTESEREAQLPERPILLTAAAVVLFFPTLNEYRSYVIREHGFLAFYLVGWWAFLRFQFTGSWRWALIWGGGMGLATLFRVEGSVFFLLAPCAVLFGGPRPWKGRFGDFLRLHTVLLAGSVLVWVWWCFLASPGQAAMLEESRASDPWRLVGELFHTLREEFPRRIDTIGGALFEDARSYAPAMFIFGLVSIVVTETIKTAHPIFGGAAVHGWWSTRRPASGRSCRGLSLHATCIYFVLLNLLCLAAIVVIRFNQTGRQALPLAVTLLPFAPFSLLLLYRRLRAQRAEPATGRGSRIRKWVFPLFVAALFFSAVDGVLTFGPTKEHLRDAGHWIRERVPHEATLFSNEFAVIHYAGREIGYAKRKGVRRTWHDSLAPLREGGWKKYDVIAIRIRRKRPAQEADLREVIGVEPVEQFQNSRGDKVLVFQVRR